MRKLELIKRKDDCVIVLNTNSRVYKVIDIENKIVCLSKDLGKAVKSFENYNIEDVRKEKREKFEKWLKENTNA